MHGIRLKRLMIHLSTNITRICVYQLCSCRMSCNNVPFGRPRGYSVIVYTLDISDNEKTVFRPVGITKYWLGAVKVATPFADDFSRRLYSLSLIRFLDWVQAKTFLRSLSCGCPRLLDMVVKFVERRYYMVMGWKIQRESDSRRRKDSL